MFRPGDQPPAGSSGVAAPQPTEPEAPSSAPVPTESAVRQPSTPRFADGPHVEWTASEYLAHQKTAGWFGLLALGTVGLTAVVFLVTRDVVSTLVIPVLGIILGVFAAREPRVLPYAVDSSGIHVADKFYPYGGFKSFSLAADQAISYISLQPLKRFMPPLIIHYDPADEDKIMDTLAAYLPFEQHKRDVVDSISRRFRF